MTVTLKSRLPQIAAELPSVVDVAVKEGAEIVAQYARVRVPVDFGDLRDAIHTRRAGLSRYEVIAGNNEVFYGHLVEHGTVRQPPRPFLVPSLEDAQDEIIHMVSLAARDL